MTIEKTIKIKIVGFVLNKERFENIVRLLNTLDYNLKLNENPCYGFQDDEHNLRINLLANNKLEFLGFYETVDDLEIIKNSVKTFLDKSVLYFKAISLEFGCIYINETGIIFRYNEPLFDNDNQLKYKTLVNIVNNEKGGVYLTQNYHFYNFGNVKNENGIIGVIISDILENLKNYAQDFNIAIER